MSASPPPRRGVLALASAILAASLALAAFAQGSATLGGTVSSTLSLSLARPSPFRRAGHTDLYTATIRAEVTATDPSTRLSIADGETSAGRRLGHLVSGPSILSPALQAAAGNQPYRSLDLPLTPLLKQWGRPIARAPVRIRLRQTAPNPGVVRSHHKLLLVTLEGAAP